jgi:hypothetical protein
MFKDKDTQNHAEPEATSAEDSLVVESSTLPQKISFEIPKSLKNPKKDELPICFSASYQRLKDNVSEFDIRKLDIEYNLDLVREVMNKKGDICQDIKVGESCIVQDVNDSTFVDKIELTRYSMEDKYQYALQFKLTFLGDDEIDMEPHNIVQSISWSEDKKHVFSKMSLEDSMLKDISQIDYQIMKNGDEKMHIYDDIVLDKSDNKHDKFNLEIIKHSIEGDYSVKSSFELTNNDFSDAQSDYITLNSVYEDSEGDNGDDGHDTDEYNFFDSYIGELHKEGGYINTISGWYPLGKESERVYLFAEYVTFDANGTILSVKVCEPGLDDCQTGDSRAVLEYCEL